MNTQHKTTKGRLRGWHQSVALELLCQRETITLHEVAQAIGGCTANAHCTLGRLEEQRLAVCVKAGKRGRNPVPSIWQLRETYERRSQPT